MADITTHFESIDLLQVCTNLSGANDVFQFQLQQFNAAIENLKTELAELNPNSDNFNSSYTKLQAQKLILEELITVNLQFINQIKEIYNGN